MFAEFSSKVSASVRVGIQVSGSNKLELVHTRFLFAHSLVLIADAIVSRLDFLFKLAVLLLLVKCLKKVIPFSLNSLLLAAYIQVR